MQYPYAVWMGEISVASEFSLKNWRLLLDNEHLFIYKYRLPSFLPTESQNGNCYVEGCVQYVNEGKCLHCMYKGPQLSKSLATSMHWKASLSSILGNTKFMYTVSGFCSPECSCESSADRHGIWLVKNLNPALNFWFHCIVSQMIRDVWIFIILQFQLSR
jgi:hypothetical protein